MLGISFTIRAYYYDITFNGQVETEGGQSESDIALDSVPGKRSKQERTKETRLSLLSIFLFSVFGFFLVRFYPEPVLTNLSLFRITKVGRRRKHTLFCTNENCGWRVYTYVRCGGAGVRMLMKPGLPEPDKWFEWQLRLYWLTSLLMLMHYGNLLHKQKKRCQLYTYLALGALALIGAAANDV